MLAGRPILPMLLATVGCAGSFRFAPGPAEGGRPWQEVKSAHFRVRTDLPEADARTAALHLERMRTALIAVAWPEAPVPRSSPMQVVVLRDRSDFQALFGQEVGAFVARNVGGQPLMVLYGRPPEWTHLSSTFEASESTLNHELAHQLSAVLRLRQPRWLSEGIACFLETVEISDDGSTATVGALNQTQHRAFMQRRFGAAREVLAWKEATPADADRLYATAWVLVHWLYNTRPEDLGRYQVRLLQGIDENVAWLLSFPGLNLDDLDRLLFAYASHGEYRSYRVPIRLADPTITSAPLAHAELHGTRARLALLATSFPDPAAADGLARAELDRALRADPSSLDALLAKQDLAAAPAERVALLRRATAAHPESGLAWLLLAELLQETLAAGAEVEAAYRSALARSPDNEIAMNNLAWLLVGQRRFAEALPLSLRAVALDPGSPDLLGTHAHVLDGLGRCAEALTVQRRAVALLSRATFPHSRKVQEDFLRALEQRCPAAASPPHTGAPARGRPYLVIPSASPSPSPETSRLTHPGDSSQRSKRADQGRSR